MHAFHMHATKDRVDASGLPDDKPVRDLEAILILIFMPSIGDSIHTSARELCYPCV